MNAPPRLLLALLLLAAPAAARANSLPPSFQALAARVMPAVVSIAAMAPAPAKSGQKNHDGTNNNDDSTATPAAGTVLPPPKTIESLGSGFVFSPAGYILTNNHVVKDADTVMVTFPDGTVYPAHIAGRDVAADLAVLKISAGHKLPYVRFGDSEKLRVGDWVLAIGNPFGLAGTSTAGIVSALHRQIGDTKYDDFIQTDAAINRGNSGGPLFNMAGQVIGVNSAIYAPNGTSDGVGFAIPAAMAKPVAEALAHDGIMRRGWLGLSTEDVTPDMARLFHTPAQAGALIGAVSPQGPSAKLLRPGDVVLSLAGRKIANPRALTIRTAEIPAGQRVKLVFWRHGARHDIRIDIAPPPAALDETMRAKEQAGPPPVLLPAVGLSLDAKPTPEGVRVLSVTGVAAKAGITAGDVIGQVNGEIVANAPALQAKLAALAKSKAPAAVLLVQGATSMGVNPGPRWVPLPLTPPAPKPQPQLPARSKH